VLDPTLTTNEHLVAYNPVTKKVLFISNGSVTTPLKQPVQFTRDWLGTNILGTGLNRIKKTARYIRDNQTYLAAKDKYKDAKVVLVGHSLAGGNVARIAKQDDTAVTLNPALINQKPRPNVENYRIQGDLVSALANDTKTLPDIHGKNLNPFHPHDINEIKNRPIYV
jgi:hypothetical protein